MTASPDEWTVAAYRELPKHRDREGAWPYRQGTAGAVEPTALAALALLAAGEAQGRATLAEATAYARAASDWLARSQKADGSLPVTAAQATPNWPTPYAILVWKALGDHTESSRRAGSWLLGQRGQTLPLSDDPEHVVGHDTTLAGWPWVSGTHSWLEPTALAVLALDSLGLGDHPRVVEGLRLVRDRAVAGGGWNYGNKAVFGRPLRPQPAPTGLALLTLVGRGPRDATIDQAIRYLATTLPNVRAAASLGWGVLGLRAWGEVPPGATGWLAEAFSEVIGRPDAAPRLAALLLGACDDALRLFGRASAAPSIVPVSVTNRGGHDVRPE